MSVPDESPVALVTGGSTRDRVGMRPAPRCRRPARRRDLPFVAAPRRAVRGEVRRDGPLTTSTAPSRRSPISSGIRSGVLVSNAGVTRDGLLLRMSEDDFTSVLDANLTASYRVAKRAARDMLRARQGRIVLMSSVVALLGSAGQANYAASKSGLVGLARSLARELGIAKHHRERRRPRCRGHRHDR